MKDQSEYNQGYRDAINDMRRAIKREAKMIRREIDKGGSWSGAAMRHVLQIFERLGQEES